MTGTGHKLVQAGHFAAAEVAARVQQLEVALNHLETEAARRRRRLQQALEVQQTSVEVRGMLSDVRTGLRIRGVYGADRCPPRAGRATLACLQLLIFIVPSKPGVSSYNFMSESPGPFPLQLHLSDLTN